LWLRRLWLRIPCRKIPVSRHPPTKLEQKVALCGANKISRPLPGEMFLHDKLPTTKSASPNSLVYAKPSYSTQPKGADLDIIILPQAAKSPHTTLDFNAEWSQRRLRHSIYWLSTTTDTFALSIQMGLK